jgi:hypothetical protein
MFTVPLSALSGAAGWGDLRFVRSGRHESVVVRWLSVGCPSQIWTRWSPQEKSNFGLCHGLKQLLVPCPTFLGFVSSPPAKLTVPATSPYPPENHSFHFNVEYFHNHEELPLATMEQRIREAREYIENFPDAKVATVARDFEVPRSTLRHRLNGCHSKKGRPGINTKLTKEEEIAICRYIDRLDKINLAVRSEFIADDARSIILARSSTKQQSVKPTIGKFWVTRFLKRHGYSKYRQKIINADRRTAQGLGIVQKYFEQLREVLENEGIQPTDLSQLQPGPYSWSRNSRHTCGRSYTGVLLSWLFYTVVTGNRRFGI